MRLPNILNVVKSWFADWRAYVAEFLATFIFIFIVLAAFIVEGNLGDLGLVGISIVTGFSYAAMVFASVHLAGGFLNPAVTLALWLVGKISSVKMIFFIIAQLLASIASAALAGIIFREGATQSLYGLPALGVGVELFNAVLLEVVLTGVLVFVIFATMVDRRASVSFGPLVLGLLLASLTAVSVPISGGFLNISRAFGSAVISQSWDMLAVWLIGPLAGSLMGIVYEVVFLRRGKK